MIKALEDKKTRSIITVVAGLICVLCLVYIAMTLFGGDRPPPKRPVKMVWFIDTGTMKLFAVDPNIPENLTPIDGPGGKPAYRAYVFACGDCLDESKQYIGFVEAFTPEARQLRLDIDNREKAGESVAFDAPTVKVLDEGQLVRQYPLEGTEWLRMYSDEAREMRQSRMSSKTNCKDGERIKACFP